MNNSSEIVPVNNTYKTVALNADLHQTGRGLTVLLSAYSSKTTTQKENSTVWRFLIFKNFFQGMRDTIKATLGYISQFVKNQAENKYPNLQPFFIYFMMQHSKTNENFSFHQTIKSLFL